MAVPSNHVSAEEKVGVLNYVGETVANAAAVLQAVPVVGAVCATFLSFEQLVDRAKSNKQELVVLRELCDFVIKWVLNRRSGSSGLLREAFLTLEKYVERGNAVANQCSSCGGVRNFILSRKICKAISSVRNDVLHFCATINLAVNSDLHVSERVSLFVVRFIPDGRAGGVLSRQEVIVTRVRFIVSCACSVRG